MSPCSSTVTVAAVFTEAPYTFSWNTTEEIDDIIYTIHAHVEDISLNQITLGPINITIDNYETNDLIPPTGNIIYPPPLPLPCLWRC